MATSIPTSTQVVVIGAGPIGLTTSILLSLHHIPHLLFERYPSTSIHPKAVGINQRTTEILRKLGVEDAVYETAAPIESSRRTGWYTSLGKGKAKDQGEGEGGVQVNGVGTSNGSGTEGREICSRDAWGGGDKQQIYEQASPTRYVLCAQIRLEPILQRRATELNEPGIFYNCEVTAVTESSSAATVTVLNRHTKQTSEVQCTYVLCCDGGRSHNNMSLASQLGVRWEGESDIMHMISAHVKAPIWRYHPDPSVFISWFINPELGGSINTGYLYHIGPYTKEAASGKGEERGSEEWVFACGVNPNEPTEFTEQDMRRRMDAVLKIPELEAEKTVDEGGKVEVLSMSHWQVSAKVVEKYRTEQGKLFFVGDAAHKIPPWGALGMNTGIQDADNLVWKVAWALKNEGDEGEWDGLLDSYGEERREIGKRVASTSLWNLRSHGLVLDKAIGIDPTNKVEANVEAMKRYFDQSSEKGEEKRKAVKEALYVLDLEFYALGLEIGWFYPSADIDGEAKKEQHAGQIDDKGEYDIRVYHPSTLPGHHLAHAWLERDGVKKSTRDLVRKDRLVLLANHPKWKDLEVEFNEVIKVEVVGEGNLGWDDVDGTWKDVCGVGETGAVLVRPDGIVSCRWEDDSFLNQRGVSGSFKELLDRMMKRR